MKKRRPSRKEVAKKRIRGLIIVLIILLSCVLIYDVFTLAKGWF